MSLIPFLLLAYIHGVLGTATARAVMTMVETRICGAPERIFEDFLRLFDQKESKGHKCQDLRSLDTYALFYVLTDQKESKGISVNIPPERETCHRIEKMTHGACSSQSDSG